VRLSALRWRVAFVAVAFVLLGSHAATAEVSFQAKSIVMLVGSEPGGGTDASGRVLAPYLSKYLPDEPKVIVQDMPGANGITALNYLFRRTQPDGLTVLMGSITTLDPMAFRLSGVQYDPQSLGFVGGIGRGGSVIFIRRSAESRLYDKSAPPVLIGSALAIPRVAMQPALWCIAYLGWNASWITGYRGTNEIMLAFDRGEVDMTSTANIFDIKDRLSSGELKIVNQTGSIENGKIVGRPEFGDAPLFPLQMQGKITDPIAQKAFAYWTAFDAGDKWLALPPDTPADVLEAYRKAFRKLSRDPNFRQQGEAISDGFAPMTAPDVGAIVRTLVQTPDDAIEYTKRLMRTQGIKVQ
jgi:hypothetical protein